MFSTDLPLPLSKPLRTRHSGPDHFSHHCISYSLFYPVPLLPIFRVISLFKNMFLLLFVIVAKKGKFILLFLFIKEGKLVNLISGFLLVNH